MLTVWQDLKYGARMLLRSPSFTIIAVLSLALGIGANTAIFTLIDAVLLRPLPFREAGKLVVVWEEASKIGFPRNTPAWANFVDWKTQNKVFEDMAVLIGSGFSLTGDGEPERLEAQAVTANMFPLLGVQPKLGRNFTEAEDQPGGPRVAILSNGLWQRRFGGDPAMVGREILLDDKKYTVIGVMPAAFQILWKNVNLWVPAAPSKQDLADRGSHYLTVIARMKNEVTLNQAQANVSAIMASINRDHRDQQFENGATVVSMREQVVGETRLALLVLMAAVGCVLLIACANIANLLLARGAARFREVAVRAALGAGRGRIIRQLLTESVLLSVAGATGGLALAWLSFAFLKQLIPESLELSASVGLDFKMLGFTLLVSLVTGILFGLAPALQAARVDLNEALKQSGGRSGSSSAHGRLRNTLAVAEIALALLLLIGAGLLVKTFVRLRTLDLGIRTDNVLTMRTHIPGSKYGELAKRSSFYQGVLERVRSLPGVVSAGYGTAVPLTWKGGTSGFIIQNKQQLPGQDANIRQVSPGWMETMGMTLRKGRFFDDHDGPQSQRVVIINETMARQYWPGEDALGRQMMPGDDSPDVKWCTIVGIVADVKEMGLEAPPKGEMFFPYTQMPRVSWNAPRTLVIRTKSDAMSIASATREAVWSVDRDQPVSMIRTLDDILGEELMQRRVGMTLLGAFAGLALLLASLGIYGILYYSVSQRTHEIGLRMALGARPLDVLRMVGGSGVALAGIGVAIGLPAAFALTRVMSSLLFNVSATDPSVFVSVPLLLIGVSLIASYLPARRATKVDPMVTLRHE
jgi:putative ABC transport system permease protein